MMIGHVVLDIYTSRIETFFLFFFPKTIVKKVYETNFQALMENQTSFITQTIHNNMKEKKRNGMFDNNFLRSKALGFADIFCFCTL